MARHIEFDKAEVLSKIAEVFWQRGYERTSIQDLVEHVGIKAQSLYNTFGGKRDLFFAALRFYADQTATVRTLDGTPSGKEAIRRAFREVAEALSRPEGANGCFIINTTVELAPHDERIAEFVENERNRVTEAYYRALTRAREQAELPEHHRDLMMLARFLNSAQAGLVVTAKTPSGRKMLDDIVRVTLSYLD